MKNQGYVKSITMLSLLLLLGSCRSLFYTKEAQWENTFAGQMTKRQTTVKERKLLGKKKEDPKALRYQKIKERVSSNRNKRKSIIVTTQVLQGNVIVKKKTKNKHYNEEGKRVTELEYWTGYEQTKRKS